MDEEDDGCGAFVREHGCTGLPVLHLSYVLSTSETLTYH